MMVSTRRKRADGDTAIGEKTNNDNEGTAEKGTGVVSGYEELREKRIRENRERLQKLGILDLKSQLMMGPTKRNRGRNVSSDDNKKPPEDKNNPLTISASPRRSSRLKSLTPVNYSEIPNKTKRESSKNVEICLRQGSQPEIYTEEHEKLLGDCNTIWTLFVDGYDRDGKRIYDQEKGETCHQCRQKTLGRHTHCSKCNLVQGQFCGDCLYMRYGENVIEVNLNPNWICPVCRGICNCSLCRKAKGWAPTGSLYKKVTRLGFRSVAHYLIQTHRSQSPLQYSGAESLVSAERELLCADKGSQALDADELLDGFADPQPIDYEDKMEVEESKMHSSNSGKHVDTNDGYDEDIGEKTVDNDGELK